MGKKASSNEVTAFESAAQTILKQRNTQKCFYFDTLTGLKGLPHMHILMFFLCQKEIQFRLNTGLFISPSRISELDCATTKIDTAERSISIGRKSLQVSFLY